MMRDLSGGRLSPDIRGFLYPSVGLNLVQLYFLTGVLANYAGLVEVNSGLLLALCAFVLLSSRGVVGLSSPLIKCYALLTMISVFNHVRFAGETGGIPEGARTMPVVLFAMMACRVLAIPGLFERSIAANTIPLAVMFVLGGHYEWGRYFSMFLGENILGSVVPFALAVGINALWERRLRWHLMITLATSVAVILLGATRMLSIFLVLASVIFVLTGRRLGLRQAFLATVVAAILVFVVLPMTSRRMAGRFGAGFSWGEHLRGVIAGKSDDLSAQTREGFLEVAYTAAQDKWLGFGNANAPYVIRTYATRYLPEAHFHAGLPEALMTAGYPGAMIYLFMLIYLFRIGRKDPIMRICLVYLVLQILLDNTLANRILWPAMAIAERELQVSKHGAREGSVTP